MKVAFLNLCHTDPELVARVSHKLLREKNFSMYIHVDRKADEEQFRACMTDYAKKNPVAADADDWISRVHFTRKRQDVSWGSFSAVSAMLQLMREASEDDHYDYYVFLQNLDYPIKSNQEIYSFFEENQGKEYIRACRIAKSRDWHFRLKYKLYHDYEDPFYRSEKTFIQRMLHGVRKLAKSLSTFGFNGVVRDQGEFPLYYGSAQWGLTDDCVRYILQFAEEHSAFNKKMQHIQFPDEEYFQTIVHNSAFRTRCVKYDEPEQRWLVNWRNLHYYEYPREITVFEEKDFEKLMGREELFCRKVRTGVSDTLLDKIDEVTKQDDENNFYIAHDGGADHISVYVGKACSPAMGERSRPEKEKTGDTHK